jgi:purine-cytosine permease-like protein
MLTPPRNRTLVIVLGVLLAANVFIRSGHPHFEAENIFGYWAGFGTLGGLALCVVGGAMLGPLLRLKGEDEGER